MPLRSIALLLAASAALAQEPRFDVESVKVWPKTTGSGRDVAVTPNSVWMEGYPLGSIIRWAYGLHTYPNYETVGPDWLEPGLGCIRFDVQGKTDRPVPVEQLRRMMRTLLAERFQLAFHRENREQTVCAIQVAKEGPRLHPSDAEDMSVASEKFGVMHFKGAQLPRLYEWLYAWVPYLILDETGLTGRYDFDLDVDQYLEAYATRGPKGMVDGSAAVNKSLQPLGLKLELQKRSVEMMVIDRVTKAPSGN